MREFPISASPVPGDAEGDGVEGGVQWQGLARCLVGWSGLAVLGWFTYPPWLLEKETVGQEEPNHVGQQLEEVGGHAACLLPSCPLGLGSVPTSQEIQEKGSENQTYLIPG